MFERRLKIFLFALSGIVLVLMFRCLQLQMLQRKYWSKEAADALKKVEYTETTRGTILDYRGRELAVDRPCVDACVDYRAIEDPPDAKWVKEVAARRIVTRLGDAWARTPKKQRPAMVEEEAKVVVKDIEKMWDKLAVVSGKTREEIEQTRQAIHQRVQMRKKYLWYYNYEHAIKKQGGKDETDNADRLEKWLSGDTSDAPPIDKFSVEVAEERSPHVILHPVTLEIQNELGRYIDRYPGLTFQAGTHRYYPYDSVACHVLGHLGKVEPADLAADPNKGDLRRRYLPNDEIGRGGLERLCEPALRGTLGRMITDGDEQGAIEQPVPGENVTTSIDVDLQQDIQSYFASATLHDTKGNVTETNVVLHGAAVLIDVKTNQVRAMVSYPVYDLNTFDETYNRNFHDDINEPLRHRATQSQLEPGSTVKPLVGLAAITQGVIGVNEGIECTGYLVLDDHHGHKIRFGKLGRCWVASMYEKLLNGAVAHHPVPFPHQGHDGNQDGFLTYSDALERSCNVYFETVADRLGIDTMTQWMDRFGLGRHTGLGIEEFKGYLPGNAPRHFAMGRRATGFFGGIGQGYIAATPIQMANVAATIARNGIWMRPKLIVPQRGHTPALYPGAIEGPDAVDLHLSPEALKACHLGMINVVNAPAGTGKAAHMKELLVAAKTGTAQASRFRALIHDDRGRPILDQDGKKQYREFEPSVPGKPNPDMPWYRASAENRLDHAWMIGYAPADDPQIAFGVLVEYGGSGGGAAADVVKASLEACIAHEYLKAREAPASPDNQQQARADAQ